MSRISYARTARDVDDLTSNERRVIAYKERRACRYVLRLTNTSDWNLPCRGDLKLLKRYTHACGCVNCHFRLNKAWRNGVRGNTKLAQFNRQRLGKSLNPCLRGRIVNLTAITKC